MKLVKLTGDPARNPSEELIERIVGGRRSVFLHWLEEQIANALYEAELRQGGWVLDMGVWGPAAFREEAARVLKDIHPDFCLFHSEGEEQPQVGEAAMGLNLS